jgi:hypothetical protein
LGSLSEVLWHLEDICGALWQHFLSKKTDWGAKGAIRRAKVESPKITSPIWTPFGGHFLKISDFFQENHVYFHCFFKALFL